MSVKSNSGPTSLVLTLENGVKVRVRPTPMAIIHAAVDSIQKPEIPMVEVKSGDKMILEPNPNDPSYQLLEATYHKEVVFAALDSMAFYGAQVVSTPDGMPKAEDEEWIDELESYGVKFYRGTGDKDGKIDISTKGKREIAWKRHIAFGTVDMSNLYAAVKNSSVISEVKVAEAFAYFQRNKEWIENSRSTFARKLADGDRVSSADSGNGEQVRGNEGGEASTDPVGSVPADAY